MPVINGSDNHNVLLGDQPIVEVRLGDELVWSTYVAFLGNEPIIEIRLGDQLLWAASTAAPAPAPAPEPEPEPEPEPIVEIELPTLNIRPVPNSTLPSLKKEDADFLSKLASGGLSLAGIALPALALPAIGGIQIPCEGGTLPTRADIVNEFNKLAQIPSKIQVYIDSLPDIKAELKAERTRLEAEARAKGEELEQKLEGLDSDVQNFNAQAEIESQIEGEIAQIKEQLQGIIDQVEEIMELIGDILSPYWKKGQVRNWQKEADDAWNELIQEYHMFIPAKMLEMISKVIPIGFNVNVLGISIDVLKVFEEEEQNRIISQIESEVDRFHSMIPAEYQQFNAEFGVKCDEWRARCTWQYVKSEIVKFCTKTLHEAFGKLIDKFKEIWDALGLPSLPAPLNFDVESFIRAQIESAKQKAEQFKTDAIAKAGQVQSDIENMDQLIQQEIDDLDAQIDNFKKEFEQELKDAEDRIKNFDLQAEAYSMIIDQLEGVSLFGMSLLDVIGGNIDETVKMPEKDIDNLIKAARDFSANWEKELLNVWIKKIKSFLDAIGLGKLLDLLTLTLCDVLPLIGIPTSFDVELPV
jgi:predicted  nucleic acid-binding Zn-ribbon protein